MKSAKLYSFLLLIVSSAVFVNAEETTSKKKDDSEVAKRYREKEPVFQPPPIPIQRRLQVNSGLEHPPSFFQTVQAENQPAKIEARQFTTQQQFQPQQQQQNSFNNFQQQPKQFQQRQENFQTFNPQPQQNFQFPQAQPQQQQPQQSFQDPNNFATFRQQENLPTLPPVHIPPNQPIGPPPNPQSPIRNLFREPEPPFSLTGLFQRFLNLFNLNN